MCTSYSDSFQDVATRPGRHRLRQVVFLAQLHQVSLASLSAAAGEHLHNPLNHYRHQPSLYHSYLDVEELHTLRHPSGVDSGHIHLFAGKGNRRRADFRSHLVVKDARCPV
jgi:hypothetical protein